MIRVHCIRNWLDAKRETSYVAADSAAVRDLVPSDMRGIEGLTAWKDGGPCDLDTVAKAGDDVTFYIRPGDIFTGAFLVQLLIGVAATVVARSLAPKLEAGDAPRIPDRDDNRSAAFSFEGPSNNRVEGLPLPVTYGEIRAGGQIVNEFIENKGPIGSFYNALISFGEGPIESICGINEDTPTGQPRRTGSTGNAIPPGLLINGVDARDLDGVELHVRLGTLEQDPVQGFERTNTRIDFDAVLDAEPSTNQAENADIQNMLAEAPTTDDDVFFETYGVSHSTAGDVDAATVTVTFPSGLFQSGSGGALKDEKHNHKVRYIELDSGGNEITTGGPDGDGWVRLRREPNVTAASRNPLSFDYTYTFFDPQTYTAPTISNHLSLNAATNNFNGLPHMVNSSPTMPWSAGETIAGMSFQAWVCLRPHWGWSTDGTSFSPTSTRWVDCSILQAEGVPIPLTSDLCNQAENPIFEWYDSTNNTGVRFSLGGREVRFSPGNSIYKCLPTAFIWDGTNEEQVWENKSVYGDVRGNISTIRPFVGANLSPDEGWAHVCFTYSGSSAQNGDRLRIYVNGELVEEKLGNFAMVAPTTASLLIGKQYNANTVNPYSSGGPGVPTPGNFRSAIYVGHLDELALWSRELSPSEIEANYASGRGRAIDETEETDLVSLWHFEGPASGNGFVTQDSTGANDLTASTSQAAQLRMLDEGIIEASVPTNTPKSSRYKIQICRGSRTYQNNIHISDSKVSAVTEHVESNLAYPTSPLMGVRLPASEQIQGSAPTVTALLKGRKVPVWDGVNSNDPTFSLEYSSNPAWVAVDMILNDSYGMGAFFGTQDVDVQAAQDVADHCDQLVYDLRPDNRVTMEPLNVSGLTTGRIVDIQFTDLGNNVGELSIAWQTGTTALQVPDGWAVGEYLGFSGLYDNTHPNIAVDLNVPGSSGTGGIRGFPIKSLSGTQLILEYDLSLYSAPWTSGQAYSTQLQSGESVSGEVMRREKRAEFNGVFDTDQAAWDSLIDVCTVGRCSPMRIGTRMSFLLRNKRTPVDLVSMASQGVDSLEFEYTGPGDRENALDIEFLDKALNYERSVVSYEHPSVQNTASLSRLRRKSRRMVGITNRSQALRHAAFDLELIDDIKRLGSFRVGPDGVAYRPGDVLRLAHDVVPRGISGRFVADGVGAVVYLDREFELESGKEYTIAVRQPVGTPGIQTRGIDESATGPATHAVGDPITLQSAFSVTPLKGEPFILYERQTQLEVEVRGVSRNQDLSQVVEFSEYVDAPYELDDAETLPDLDTVVASTSEPDSGQLPLKGPADVIDLGVFELDYSPEGRGVVIRASWTHPASSASPDPAYTAVSVNGNEVATTTSDEIELEVPDVEPGQPLTLTATPVSAKGQRARGRTAYLSVVGLGKRPEAPTGIAATFEGDKVTYSWALPNEKLAVECRRGGWVTGQHVFTAPPGATSFGPTRDWVDGGPLYFRCKDRLGYYSDATLYTLTADIEPPAVAIGVAYPDAGFSEFSGPTVSNLGLDSDGYYYISTGTSGSYTAPEPDITGNRPRWIYVEAYVDAVQEHSLAWGDVDAEWGSRHMERWTWEGPTFTYPDETSPASVSIEYRLNGRGLASSWGEWHAYKPGLFLARDVQFRILATRPDEDFNVRIRSITTKLRARRESDYERTAFQRLMESQL